MSPWTRTQESDQAPGQEHLHLTLSHPTFHEVRFVSTLIQAVDLVAAATTAAGRVEEALAFNGVTVSRHTSQSANSRVVVDRVERIAKFVGDGMIVATAGG